MNNTLLSTISVMNFNNIGTVRSAAKKAYGPSTDFLFSNFPVSKSFTDYIDSAAEQKVSDFIDRYYDNTSDLNELSNELKQLFINTYESKEVRVDSDTLEAVAKQDAMIKEYDFTVEQLATVQQNTSTAIKGSESNLTEFGNTELTINQDEETFNISVDTEGASNNQEVLKRVSATINKSEANVSAKVLTDDDGNVRLSVESKETGQSNAFDITGDLTTFIDLKSISSAQNSKYTIDGEAGESDANTILLDEGQLEVTFKEETDTTETIGVEFDTEPIESQLSDLASQLQDMEAFLSDYSTDNRMMAKYERRLNGLFNQFADDLSAIGIEKSSDGSIQFSKETFQANFDEEGTDIIKELDKASGFINKLDKFSDDLEAQNVQTLIPASNANNLPTFMQDDFISYLSLSRGFNINAFYPTGGILDFML